MKTFVYGLHLHSFTFGTMFHEAYYYENMSIWYHKNGLKYEKVIDNR